MNDYSLGTIPLLAPPVSNDAPRQQAIVPVHQPMYGLVPSAPVNPYAITPTSSMVPPGMTIYQPGQLAPVQNASPDVVVSNLTQQLSCAVSEVSAEVARMYQGFSHEDEDVAVFKSALADLMAVGEVIKSTSPSSFFGPTGKKLLAFLKGQQELLVENIDHLAHAIETKRRIMSPRVTVLKDHVGYLLDTIGQISGAEVEYVAGRRAVAEDEAETQAIRDTVASRTKAMDAMYLGRATMDRTNNVEASFAEAMLPSKIRLGNTQIEKDIALGTTSLTNLTTPPKPERPEVTRARHLAQVSMIVEGPSAIWKLLYLDGVNAGIPHTEAEGRANLILDQMYEFGTVSTDVCRKARAELDARRVDAMRSGR